MNSLKLTLRQFAQIDAVDVDFGGPGDLTVLVGQQATGKSLVLQWLKLLTDPLSIRRDWEQFGANWKTGDELRPLNLFFGEGLGAGFRAGTTRLALNGQEVKLGSLFRRANGGEPVEATYFIPAHRALLLSDGWPKRFQQHGVDTPYVARAQSERLARWLGDADASIFPVANRLPKELRDLFDESIFHSATLDVDRTGPQSRLVLRAGEAQAIPYMAWTAGQREFVPLLIALYELMPAGALSRLQNQSAADIETVIVEEPELGLHPRALFAVGIALLHLLGRGYRVVVSTHSPQMVDFAWALNRLRVAHQHGKASVGSFLRAFGMKSTTQTKALATRLLQSHSRTYYLSYQGAGQGPRRVTSKDISGLQTYSDDPETASWGELLKYSSSLADAVGQLDLDFSALADSELAA